MLAGAQENDEYHSILDVQHNSPLSTTKYINQKSKQNGRFS